MEIINFVTENAAQIGVVVAAVIGVATAITKLTPTKEDDKFLAKYVLPIVGYLSFLKPAAAGEKGALKLPIVGDLVSAVKGLKKTK